MSSLSTTALYPLPSQSTLDDAFVGRSLASLTIPTPTAVIDLAVARKNCSLMLTATKVSERPGPTGTKCARNYASSQEESTCHRG